MQHFTLPKLVSRDRQIARITAFLSGLSLTKGWVMEVKELKSRRTISQNRLLWALYDQILKRGGESMAGWVKEDLHEFFLANHFGSEVRVLLGMKKRVPLNRSSELNKQDFADFVDSIVRFMAFQGVALDMPEDQWSAAA